MNDSYKTAVGCDPLNPRDSLPEDDRGLVVTQKNIPLIHIILVLCSICRAVPNASDCIRLKIANQQMSLGM